MKATDKNFELVKQIIKLLSDADCTVKDAAEILSYVSQEVTASSKVQEASSLPVRLGDANYRMSHGMATSNQIRKEFGLEPVDDPVADILLTVDIPDGKTISD